MDLLNSDWFAGFVDGEGSLGILRPQSRGGGSFAIRLQVSQRNDRRDVLEEMQNVFGGRIYTNTTTHKNPLATWHIQNKQAIMGIVAYFDKHPLYVKQIEYQIWRAAAFLYYRHSKGSAGPEGNPQWLIDTMLAYKASLEGARKYGANNPKEVRAPARISTHPPLPID